MSISALRLILLILTSVVRIDLPKACEMLEDRNNRIEGSLYIEDLSLSRGSWICHGFDHDQPY